MKKIRIGTRRSNLAIYQAKRVSNVLEHAGIPTQIVEISSAGDRSLGGNLSEGLGQFVTSVDNRLISGEIDIAVHSSKDVPVEKTSSVTCLAYLERGPTSDIILFRKSGKRKDLSTVLKEETSSSIEEVMAVIPKGGKFGSSSVRRQSFFLARRKDVLPLAVRGNVESRIQKLVEGKLDAIILAEAGLSRLQETGSLSESALKLGALRIPKKYWPTAPGQGAICIHCLSDRIVELSNIREILNHQQTEIDVSIEKEILRRLGGGCQFPAGIESNEGEIQGLIAPDNWRETYSSGSDYELKEIHDRDVKEVKFSAPYQGVQGTNSGPKIVSTLNSDRLTKSLSNVGIPSTNIPVIQLDLIPENWPELSFDQTSPKSNWPVLVLTSPFSAKAASLMAPLRPNLQRIMWLAIGEGTARSCFRQGYPASITANSRNRKELLQYILQNIKPEIPLFIPQSSSSSGYLAKMLAKAGYIVDSWVAYSNSPKQVNVTDIRNEDILLLSSPSSAESWIGNNLLIPEKILCMGYSTKTSLDLLDGFRGKQISVLEGPTLQGIEDWWNQNIGG